MKRIIAILAISLGVLSIPTSATATQARTWVPTACYSQAPYNSMVYGMPGTGAYYRNAYTSPYEQLVHGKIHQFYAATGYECGRFGLVFYGSSDTNSLGRYNYNYFIRPGSCSLRTLVEYTTGSYTGVAYESEYKNAFCTGP